MPEFGESAGVKVAVAGGGYGAGKPVCSVGASNKAGVSCGSGSTALFSDMDVGIVVVSSMPMVRADATLPADAESEAVTGGCASRAGSREVWIRDGVGSGTSDTVSGVIVDTRNSVTES